MKENYFTPSELKKLHGGFLNEEQLKIINRKTPKSEIEIKTNKAGEKYRSVKAPYIKKQMILLFGFDFDFEVKGYTVIKETNEVLTECRLTIRNEGKKIIREQFGSSDIEIKKPENHFSNIANSHKAAATDAFKKCASEIGVCWDIYSDRYSVDSKKVDPKMDAITERLNSFFVKCKTASDVESVYKQFKDNNVLKTEHIKLYNKFTAKFKK